jgi:SAM-dependent methyltransferase
MPIEDVLNRQHSQWEGTYSEEPYLYGESPSYGARKAARLFRGEGAKRILELGCGHGRDTLYFAKNGMKVHAVDFSRTAIEAMTKKANELSLSEPIAGLCHDVREPLPFAKNSFDGCYSHMLYCMALTSDQLARLTTEIRGILKPNGLNIYTARNTKDKHYGKGIHRGEDMYEVDGFIVHFLSEGKMAELARGFKVLSVEEFEEGNLPRRLSLVTLRKQP